MVPNPAGVYLGDEREPVMSPLFEEGFFIEVRYEFFLTSAITNNSGNLIIC
jgi:hypothetical protein